MIDKVQISQLINDLENDSIALSQGLLRCKRIYTALNHSKLKEFVEKELEGNFTPEDIPKYRRKYAEPVGVFQNRFNGAVNNVTLNFDRLIKETNLPKEDIYIKDLAHSVPEMEDFIKKADTTELMIEFTQSQLDIARRYLDDDYKQGWYLIQGVFKFSYSTFGQIISITKSRLIELLIEIENGIHQDSNIEKESFFENGKAFEALMALAKLTQKATKSITLIDGYVDNNTLNFFSNKKPHIRVNILTNKKCYTPNLMLFADAFNLQYQNLEIRKSNNFHDRFLIIDDNKIYHIGASLKDAGKKTFMFTEIEESIIKDSILEKFKSEWN